MHSFFDARWLAGTESRRKVFTKGHGMMCWVRDKRNVNRHGPGRGLVTGWCISMGLRRNTYLSRTGEINCKYYHQHHHADLDIRLLGMLACLLADLDLQYIHTYMPTSYNPLPRCLPTATQGFRLWLAECHPRSIPPVIMTRDRNSDQRDQGT